jgi:hypothetical protein
VIRFAVTEPSYMKWACVALPVLGIMISLSEGYWHPLVLLGIAATMLGIALATIVYSRLFQTYLVVHSNRADMRMGMFGQKHVVNFDKVEQVSISGGEMLMVRYMKTSRPLQGGGSTLAAVRLKKPSDAEVAAWLITKAAYRARDHTTEPAAGDPAHSNR